MAQKIQPDRPIWPSVPDPGLDAARGGLKGDAHLGREGAPASDALPIEPRAQRVPRTGAEGLGPLTR
ncbi:hypothetical protein [Methylobacterium nigriterrae]|uniref:hypothetical protein n=1 Tax=Methylobacterium nigriterrae TaxID=3127512 RepID=UPI003013FB8C